MRILVCGGRKFADNTLVRATLDDIVRNVPALVVDDGKRFYPDVTIIHGNANGTDTLADAWAKDNGAFIIRYRALFETYGSMAGQIRNTRMLVDGKPDVVVAFPGQTGTRHMVDLAKERGVRVLEINGRRP